MFKMSNLILSQQFLNRDENHAGFIGGFYNLLRDIFPFFGETGKMFHLKQVKHCFQFQWNHNFFYIQEVLTLNKLIYLTEKLFLRNVCLNLKEIKYFCQGETKRQIKLAVSFYCLFYCDCKLVLYLIICCSTYTYITQSRQTSTE